MESSELPEPYLQWKIKCPHCGKDMTEYYTKEKSTYGYSCPNLKCPVKFIHIYLASKKYDEAGKERSGD